VRKTYCNFVILTSIEYSQCLWNSARDLCLGHQELNTQSQRLTRVGNSENIKSMTYILHIIIKIVKGTMKYLLC